MRKAVQLVIMERTAKRNVDVKRVCCAIRSLVNVYIIVQQDIWGESATSHVLQADTDLTVLTNAHVGVINVTLPQGTVFVQQEKWASFVLRDALRDSSVLIAGNNVSV